MKLKSFGCSFIWGSELSDITNKNKKFSLLTWPALIAQQKSLEYQCYARPGAGNFYILQSILTELNPNDIYLINWTFGDRFDYVFAHGEKTVSSWHSILPWDENDRANFYYKNFHSEFVDKLQNLVWIACAVDALTAMGAKFTMTFMDDLLFDNRWNCTAGTTYLQNKVRPFLHQFDGLNFVAWSKKKGFPVGTVGNHPLEAAHRAAADYLLGHRLV